MKLRETFREPFFLLVPSAKYFSCVPGRQAKNQRFTTDSSCLPKSTEVAISIARCSSSRLPPQRAWSKLFHTLIVTPGRAPTTMLWKVIIKRNFLSGEPAGTALKKVAHHWNSGGCWTQSLLIPTRNSTVSNVWNLSGE